MVQLKKVDEFEAIVGMQADLTVTLQRNSGGISIAVGQQKWIDKAAVGVVGFAIPVLWPLLFTAGLWGIFPVGLVHPVLDVVDGVGRLQQPRVQAGRATVIQVTT